MFDKQKFVVDCNAVRRQSPLVHNITNYVAMNIAANGLLAIGASPLMSFCPEEMDEIVGISNALAINIGCLDSQQIKAMHKAAAAANEKGKPWVLDPVGAGASRLRTQTALDLITKYRPAVIRGNASEIMFLAKAMGFNSENISSRGVDSSVATSAAEQSAIMLAKHSGAVVSVSGAVDFITDGEHIGTISNGSPLMPLVSALGCTATAITAAFAAAGDNHFLAAWNAMALMGVVGEIAAESACGRGTGTFAIKFLDALSTFNPEKAAERVKE